MSDDVLKPTTSASPPADHPAGSDADHLRAFVQSGDSGAFESIVRWHGPMVLGVCQRVLQHRQDAEDAFQAVFVVLARKASSIRPPEKLPAWLYSVAHRTALKARGMRKTRQEKEAMWQNPGTADPGADTTWKDLAPIVDQELMRLPEQQRLALILSIFEGQSKSEIAGTLGVATGTVSSRLARAREALRERLARRGIAITATALGTTLASNAGAAVSEGLIVQTTQTAAMAVATAAGVAVPASVVALSNGVLHAMFISKLKVIVAWVITISILGTGSGFMIYSAIAKDAPVEKSGKPAADPTSQVRGNIVSVEGDNLTIGTNEDGQKVRKTFMLVGENGISLAADAKGQEPTPGKRDHLVPGASVVITLDPDGKTVGAIQVMGRSAGGTIETVEKDSITVTGKGKDGKQTVKYKVNDATAVILSFGKEKGDVQRGTIADLKPGMQVSISVSAAEKDLARSISVQPQQARAEKPEKGSK